MLDKKYISKIHNPYDFSNPISDENLFIGRKQELQEIDYYLNHAKTAPRPINIALLGIRAAGKTSFLNISEIKAIKKDFCTVRINLDEDDSKTLLNFFFKIFDSILLSVCEQGAFNGISGETYQTYLEIVSTCNIPKEKIFCNFLFPLQYAKAMSSGNRDMQFSDNIFIRDLKTITSAIDKPIVLIIDEGNVLITSRIHLEKLRNIFMNIPRFMIIIAGTKELFPIMDDVFSPIIRQFKKIIISEFKDINETEDCIIKPLKNIGISNPKEQFEIDNDDIINIHKLSGGKPYEIQLICHFLFHRIQQKIVKNFKLNLALLEDVLNELESTQDISSRPILTSIKKLNQNQLKFLSTFSFVDGSCNLNIIWALEYIFNNNNNWNKSTFKKEYDNFIKAGIIKTKNKLISFCGDDFDKIYTKYYAREQKVNIDFKNYSITGYWQTLLYSFINSGLRNVNNLYIRNVFGKEILLKEIIHNITDKKQEKDSLLENIGSIERIYFFMLDFQDRKRVPIIETNIKFPWISAQNFYYINNSEKANNIKELISLLELVKKRVIKLGGIFKIEKIELPIIPIKKFVEIIKTTENQKLRRIIIIEHLFKMLNEYLVQNNLDKAIVHAELLYNYRKFLEMSHKNNIGYLFLANNNLEIARDLFNSVIKEFDKKKESDDKILLALSYYNLGILESKDNKDNINNSISLIKKCIKKIKSVRQEDRNVDCVFSPSIVDNELSYSEKKNIDLLEISKDALEVLKSFKSH